MGKIKLGSRTESLASVYMADLGEKANLAAVVLNPRFRLNVPASVAQRVISHMV